MGEPADATSPSHEADLRRLVQLEREAAEIRHRLGLAHRVVPIEVTGGAEEAAHVVVGVHASVFLSLHAADGRWLWASPSSASMFGWTPEQLIGRSAYEMFHPEDMMRISENHAQHADSDQPPPIEYRFRTQSGSYRWVRTHSRNVKGPSQTLQIVCFTHDVTEQRERLESLERLLARQAETEAGHWPMCAWCKSVRRSATAWQSLEAFLLAETGRETTHTICPSCIEHERLALGLGRSAQ